MERMEVMIRKRRLRWLGHVGRMGEERMPQQILFGRLKEGKRRPGGPKKSWMECARDDVRAFGMDEREWFEKCQDRRRWRKMLEEGAVRLDEKLVEKDRLRREHERERRRG